MKLNVVSTLVEMITMFTDNLAWAGFTEKSTPKYTVVYHKWQETVGWLVWALCEKLLSVKWNQWRAQSEMPIADRHDVQFWWCPILVQWYLHKNIYITDCRYQYLHKSLSKLGKIMQWKETTMAWDVKSRWKMGKSTEETQCNGLYQVMIPVLHRTGSLVITLIPK